MPKTSPSEILKYNTETEMKKWHILFGKNAKSWDRIPDLKMGSVFEGENTLAIKILPPEIQKYSAEMRMRKGISSWVKNNKGQEEFSFTTKTALEHRVCL